MVANVFQGANWKIDQRRTAETFAPITPYFRAVFSFEVPRKQS
jgi:hypothetical protein